MLMVNVLAKLDRVREELEAEEKDLKRIDNLIKGLQDQRRNVVKEISYLEGKIEELEDELDG